MRLVAKGYSQQEGINCKESYALVVHQESIPILLSFTAHSNTKLYQMDVKKCIPQ